MLYATPDKHKFRHVQPISNELMSFIQQDFQEACTIKFTLAVAFFKKKDKFDLEWNAMYNNNNNNNKENLQNSRLCYPGWSQNKT